MGLFSRKHSKADVINTTNGRAALGPGFHTERISDYSIKSPRLVQTTIKPVMVTPRSDIPLPPAPDPTRDPAGYLRSIYAVRERSRVVLEKAKSNRLQHFDVDLTKFQDTADYVVSMIKVSKNSTRRSCASSVVNLYYMLIPFSEIFKESITQFLLMADGSTLKSVADLG